jgi:hypothetical protein
MKIKITQVDAATGIPCTVEPMRRGPAYPNVKGLKILFGDQRNWPTNTPFYIAECDDDADLDVRGVIGVMSDEDVAREQLFENDNQAARVRQIRNGMISSADWTQVLDAPVDQAVWAEYRQALRDVPQQAGFPWDVQWPDEPTPA